MSTTQKRIAPMSIQPHVLMGREGMRPLVAGLLNGQHPDGSPIMPEQRTTPFRMPDMNGDQTTWQVTYPNGKRSYARRVIRGVGLHYDIGHKLLYIELVRPLFDAELKGVTEPASLAVQAFKKQTGQQFPLERLDLPKNVVLRGRLDGLIMSRVGVLAKTSKMGCYSMNQPAGPQRKWKGSCPASAFGFAMLHESERVQARIESRIDAPINPELSICNGCYALKGAYGNPSQQSQVEVRRQFFDVMLNLDPIGLVDILVFAIRVSQAKSRMMRMRLEKRGLKRKLADVPNPAFFRIHDAGDCYSSELFLTWIKVAQAMPDTVFWMPTRMWLIPSVLGPHLHLVPPNFIVRPSAFHFGDAVPAVAGYAQGAGATFMSHELSAKDINAAREVVGELVRIPGGKKIGGKGFICPAYMPEHWGGGLRKVRGKPKLAGGGCTRAQGIGTQQRPEDKGGIGCRVCWLNPDVRVIYPEH